MPGVWGAEVTARLSEAAFFYLDAPIKRVAAPNTPAPGLSILEKTYVPNVEKVVKAAYELAEI